MDNKMNNFMDRLNPSPKKNSEFLNISFKYVFKTLRFIGLFLNVLNAVNYI